MTGPELRRLEGMALAEGHADGLALRLDDALSFWGGIDPRTGEVIDRRHPQAGRVTTGRVLLLPSGRGSSSSSSVLGEAVRLGTAPAAILLREPDPILAVGAMVARELYGRGLPMVVLSASDHASVGDGDRVIVHARGTSCWVNVREGPRRDGP